MARRLDKQLETTRHFSPNPIHENEITILLGLLSSILTDRVAIYLSAPITTGKVFTDWYTTKGKHLNPLTHQYKTEHALKVMKQNSLRSNAFAYKLRQELQEIVIDPSAVADFPDWTQDDYRYFWASVIRKYAKAVVFMNGWQYSNGCSYEFLTALECGAKALNEERDLISIETGIQLIEAATYELKTQGISTVFMEKVLENLINLRYNKIKRV